MAKTSKKQTEKPGKKKPELQSEPIPEPTFEIIDPQKVHQLFGLSDPYDPPAPPVGVRGFVTFWDPGCSIQTLVKKFRHLFYLKSFDGRFAKDTDSWRWKHISLTPIAPDQTFAEQRKKLLLGEPPAARELVTYLILHSLVTGVRLDINRLRCRDMTEHGRRLIVGPFSDLGLDIGSVSDERTSPNIALCEILTPAVKRK
jgi:hypothetical protein